ncbi:17642_t:CDS:1, partial [Funneliformis caledonium]
LAADSKKAELVELLVVVKVVNVHLYQWLTGISYPTISTT